MGCNVRRDCSWEFFNFVIEMYESRYWYFVLKIIKLCFLNLNQNLENFIEFSTAAVFYLFGIFTKLIENLYKRLYCDSVITLSFLAICCRNLLVYMKAYSTYVIDIRNCSKFLEIKDVSLHGTDLWVMCALTLICHFIIGVEYNTVRNWLSSWLAYLKN